MPQDLYQACACLPILHTIWQWSRGNVGSWRALDEEDDESVDAPLTTSTREQDIVDLGGLGARGGSAADEPTTTATAERLKPIQVSQLVVGAGTRACASGVGRCEHPGPKAVDLGALHCGATRCVAGD